MNGLNLILKVFRAHGDAKQRALIQKLGKQKTETFPAIKTICTGDYAPSIQRWAVEALGVYPLKDALPFLRKALRSPHMSVRLHAVRAIGRLGNPDLARYVKSLTRDESGGIRMNALETLCSLKPRDLKAVLKKALSDEKWYIRQYVERKLDSTDFASRRSATRRFPETFHTSRQ